MSGFVLTPFGDVAEFINGDRGTNYPSKSDFAEKGIPFINAGHLTGGEVDFAEMNYISEDRFHKLGSGKTRANDLLYCLRGSLGKTAIVRHNGDAAIASSLVIIRPCEKCSVEYLYRCLTSPLGEAEIRRFNSGSSQPNLSATNVKKYQIPLPPLAEQKRIAGILDAADALRVKRRESLAQLDTLLQSTFLDMFGDPVTNPMGWEKCTVGDIGVMGTGSTPSRKDAANYGGGIPWVKSTEVDWCVVESTSESVTEEGVKAARLKMFPAGSVVVALYGQGKTRGKCAILGMDATSNQASCVIMPNDNCNNLFLFYFLRHSYAKLRGQSRGGNQENLNMRLIREFPMILPPLDLQQRFATVVESIEEQKTLMRAHLDELDALFASLQSRAFSGEL